MALTREQKEQRVIEVSDALSTAASVAFMAFDKFNVDDMEDLRDQLFAAGVRLRVMPKRLLKLVADKLKLAFDPRDIEGQVAVLWGADPVAPAKVLYTFARKHDMVQLAAGVLDGRFLSQEEVTALAQLPGRDELRGQLVSVIAGPIKGFVTVLTGAQRNFVYALSAIRDQKQEA